jgi:hypothetical protein
VSQILSVEDVRFTADNRCVVDAVVADAVIIIPATREEPAEWGPALCRGSFYFSEEDVIPNTDSGLRRMFEDRIDDWEPLDTSDCE